MKKKTHIYCICVCKCQHLAVCKASQNDYGCNLLVLLFYPKLYLMSSKLIKQCLVNLCLDPAVSLVILTELQAKPVQRKLHWLLSLEWGSNDKWGWFHRGNLPHKDSSSSQAERLFFSYQPHGVTQQNKNKLSLELMIITNKNTCLQKPIRL